MKHKTKQLRMSKTAKTNQGKNNVNAINFSNYRSKSKTLASLMEIADSSRTKLMLQLSRQNISRQTKIENSIFPR